MNVPVQITIAAAIGTSIMNIRTSELATDMTVEINALRLLVMAVIITFRSEVIRLRTSPSGCVSKYDKGIRSIFLLISSRSFLPMYCETLDSMKF